MTRRWLLLLLVLIALLGAAAAEVYRGRHGCPGPFGHLDDRLLGRSYSVRCAG